MSNRPRIEVVNAAVAASGKAINAQLIGGVLWGLGVIGSMYVIPEFAAIAFYVVAISSIGPVLLAGNARYHLIKSHRAINAVQRDINRERRVV